MCCFCQNCIIMWFKIILMDLCFWRHRRHTVFTCSFKFTLHKKRFQVNFILQALVEFFQRVIDQQAKNKMTLNNVSVVMAPNIFMFKGFRSKVTEQQEFSMATSTANIVRLLIRYQNLLWTVT